MLKMFVIFSAVLISMTGFPLIASAEEAGIPAGAMPELPPDNMNWYDKYEALTSFILLIVTSISTRSIHCLKIETCECRPMIAGKGET